ncbi:Putative multidrug efflux protein [Mycoavidus cysteinexigens]|uniref:Multidrug efflux protein n=1 Tax=Mycoavidus cysteinexigens TaxID=1553431 RepID=A0A2Z6EUW2_9BURK|nr:MFS transporter [Mycoavidus cysteinexigens]BBE09263.1 Putative multidrug efflux protein [Mycoavidus cysteinexigens]GLR02079.1 MFS transporter [Mycoavidus cysteinexigens]
MRKTASLTPLSANRPLFILQIIIAAALFMEGIDASMLSTALPAIAASFQVDVIQLKLAFVAYFLAMAIAIPISGWCADRFGARTIFCSALTIFTLASIACACAPNFYIFLVGRSLQGVSGALVFPVGRLILVRSMPKSEFIRAFSNVTIPATIGIIVGPMLGGFLTTYMHWSWLFWINLPIGIAIIAVGLKYVPKFRGAPPAFDLIGFLLSGFGLAALGYGFSALGDRSLPAHTVALLTMSGVVLMLVYFWRARKMVAPALDLRLFSIKTYRIGIVCGFIIRAVGAGTFFFLLPMMLQVGFGFTPLQSGSVTFASAAGFLAAKCLIQKILRRFGFRRALSINAIIGSLCIGMLALFLPTTPRIVMIALLFVAGLSRCLQYMALDIMSYADMPPSAVSRASTMANVSKQLAMAGGVAFAAWVLERVEATRQVFYVDITNFHIAFILVAIPAMATLFMLLRMAPDAGKEVSGHQPPVRRCD